MNLLGIKEDVWTDILLPNMSTGLSHHNRMDVLVIVTNEQDVLNTAKFYQDRFGEKVDRLKIEEGKEVNILLKNGDRFSFMTSERVNKIQRGRRFNLITLAKY